MFIVLSFICLPYPIMVIQSYIILTETKYTKNMFIVLSFICLPYPIMVIQSYIIIYRDKIHKKN